MNDSAEDSHRAAPMAGGAFLLAQLGAHAAAEYAKRIDRLGLNPAHTGVLRLVAIRSGLSQQALAGVLGVAPSRIVALVDELETRGLLERQRSATDRRNYELRLTALGEQLLGDIRTIAQEHEAAVTSGLTADERHQLVALLQKVADLQGLTPGVHPGYRAIRS